MAEPEDKGLENKDPEVVAHSTGDDETPCWIESCTGHIGEE